MKAAFRTRFSEPEAHDSRQPQKARGGPLNSRMLDTMVNLHVWEDYQYTGRAVSREVPAGGRTVVHRTSCFLAC